MSEVTLDKIVSLAKRRGFAYQSSEIYGGMANSWDFGPVGTLLKNNLRDSWWKFFVLDPDDMVGIDASIFLSPKVWEASGHVANFTDVMVEDKETHKRYRADHLIEEHFEKNSQEVKVDGKTPEELQQILAIENIKSPEGNDLTDPKRFNLLFETSIGIVEGEKSKAYLRGEIAQGIFVNFKNVLDSTRIQVPFGIAQVGKAFRNEITMGQFLNRTLEFDLMEFEYFIKPSEWEDAMNFFQEKMTTWSQMIGLNQSNIRWRQHEDFERSHYSNKTLDLEYKYPFGWKELFGLAHRTDYDLKNHMEKSGKDLMYTDPMTHEKYLPHVVEPTFGLSRLVGVVLTDAYWEDKKDDKVRTVLRLDPKIAPYKAAIFPLLANKEELLVKSKELHDMLKDKFSISYDGRGNIGKRYLAQDEIGTPFCITIDFQTLDDDTVTVRDRDTTEQIRVPMAKIEELLTQSLSTQNGPQNIA